MAPDDHDNHDDPPQAANQPPKPLLDDATATIYLDGLIYTGYNQNEQLFEGAVLTDAEGHHLVIEVALRHANGHKMPVWRLEASHEIVKTQAPFWLYVDSGGGLQKREFNAQLHRDGTQSIANVLSFEQLHERALPPKPETYALFNFPHGTTYSADFARNVKLKSLAQGEIPAQAQPVRDIPVLSTLAGIDINTVSNGAGKKYIVLANKDGGNELLRLELEEGKRYEIQILNQPIEHDPSHDPREHFLQFYELFVLRPNERMFLVDPPIASPAVNPPQPNSDENGEIPPSPPHSPPCVITIGDTEGGLRG